MKKALVLGLLLAIAFQVIHPFFFMYDDNVMQFYPAAIYQGQKLLLEHQVPLVDLYLNLGTPYLGQGQYGPFYLPRLASFVVAMALGHPPWVIDIEATLHFLLAIVGMTLLLRACDVPPGWAEVGGIAYACNGFFLVVGRSWLEASPGVAQLPWELWLIKRYLDSGRASMMVWLAVLRGLDIHQGYVQFSVYGLFFETLYFLLQLRGRETWRRDLLLYSLSLLASIAISAPTTLALLDAFSSSSRQTNFQDYYKASVPPLDLLLGSVVPFPLYDGTFHFANPASAGLLFNPLPFAVLYVLGLRRLKPRPLLLAALVTAACELLPLETWFRISADTGLPSSGPWRLDCVISLAVLAGLTLTTWRWQRGAERQTELLLLLLAVSLSGGVFSPLSHLLSHVPLWGKFRFSFKFILYVHCFAMLAAARWLRGSPRVMHAATVLVVAQGLYAAAMFGGFASPQFTAPANFDTVPLDVSLFAGARIMPAATTPSGVASRDYWDRDIPLPVQIETQASDFSLLYRTFNATGYQVVLDQTQQGLDRVMLSDDRMYDEVGGFLQAYGVQWYLVPRADLPHFQVFKRAQFRVVPWRPDTVAVHDLGAQPLCHLATNVQSISYRLARDQFDMDLPPVTKPDALILAFYNHSHRWQATVDGERREVTDDALQRISVPIKPGDRHVHLWYGTPGYTLGLWLCCLGSPLLLLLLWWLSGRAP